MPLTEEQTHSIREQIGREPRGIVRIAAQSAEGTPLVLQMRSLVDDKPFPTLYWLCSQRLCKAIGQIEGKGTLKVLEAQLQDDDMFLADYMADQKRYVAKRWALMLDEDKKRIETLGFTPLFHKYGIGGIAKWDKIRCLHMQYAYHLAEGSVIGAMMDEQFGLQHVVSNG